ncbi:hypothetical protein [Nitrosococcus oceani]|uniref:hypothetical protein n=1 Tax=Nitrosococcus oceani TaxID=1229 RepID=UPI000B269CB9|nr:hypothetical protein [Nitrosococcus oceani]
MSNSPPPSQSIQLEVITILLYGDSIKKQEGSSREIKAGKGLNTKGLFQRFAIFKSMNRIYAKKIIYPIRNYPDIPAAAGDTGWSND